MRRWGWVSFFLVMLLLCAAAWGVSYWRWMSAIFNGAYSFAYLIGDGSFCCWGGHWASGGAEPFYGATYKYLPNRLLTFYDDARYQALGFAFDSNFQPSLSRREWMLIFPLWLPTVLSGIGFLWACRRKRRRDVKLKRGFPVSAAADAPSNPAG